MISLGKGETRLLGRLAINPASRQAQLARDLQITRSAINQLWKKLERINNLRILSNLDYGKIGFQSIYGWACCETEVHGLENLQKWLTSNPYSKEVFRSLMTSKMDNRVFFEAVVPVGPKLKSFLSTLERFRKKPYSLDITYDLTLAMANHLNFGYYDGTKWNFESDFRFEATIDAARNFADILPIAPSRKQSAPRPTTIELATIASVLESNYFCTSSDLVELLTLLNLPLRSDRTLRRRLNHYRSSIAQAYLSLENIGLVQKVIITLAESEKSDIYKLLRTQAATFPKVRILTGIDSIGLVLELPQNTNWAYISNILANIIGRQSETCTFIAEQVQKRKWLENIVIDMKKSKG